MHTDQITLVTDDFSGPAIPESFERQLRALDPTLLVRWNGKRMRFVIEQCVGHHANGPQHSHLCERIYVFLVQDPEGAMMPLGEVVITKIRARDVTRAGYGPEDLHRWTAERADEDKQNKERIKQQQNDAVRHCTRFNRRQVLKAFNQLANMGSPNR